MNTAQHESVHDSDSHNVVGMLWDDDTRRGDGRSFCEEDAAVTRIARKHGLTPNTSTPATPRVRVQHDPNIPPNDVALLESLPPQLHPAVSLGMRRVSSAYWSIRSTSGHNASSGSISSDSDASNALSHAASFADLWSLRDAYDTLDRNDELPTAETSPAGVHSSGAAIATETKLGEMVDEEILLDTVAAGMSIESETEHDQATTTPSYPKTTAPPADGGLLYHDILTHVFTFLDARDLAAFSETARRPNFETFYFLQLQLQRALLVGGSRNHNHVDPSQTTTASDDPCDDADSDTVSVWNAPLAGVGCVTRLAQVDRDAAEQVVQTFLSSNTTLPHMPLSHSLVFLRHFLLRSQHTSLPHRTRAKTTATDAERSSNADRNESEEDAQAMRRRRQQQSQTIASAALFITFLGGAASMMGGSDLMTPDNLATLANNTELLFKVGVVGSLMGAAQKGYEQKRKHQKEKLDSSDATSVTADSRSDEREDQLLVTELQPFSTQEDRYFFPSFSHMMQAAYQRMASSTGDLDDSKQHDEPLVVPQTPNPYEHLPASEGITNSVVATNPNDTMEDTGENPTISKEPVRKSPTGCVGAYSKAVRGATSRIVAMILERRREKFNRQVAMVREELASTLIDACSSDDHLDTVIDLVRRRGVVDVEGFHVGTDGTETCALHAAAFHGSAAIVDFLCRGIDETDPNLDGGLCDVNLRDANGWTAAHFAAGANAANVIRVLAAHGADLKIEAANGYTPLQWALRLQNEGVAEVLRQMVGSEPSWMSRQPLTAIASRFFALIPTH
jgi:hypothetical protein